MVAAAVEGIEHVGGIREPHRIEGEFFKAFRAGRPRPVDLVIAVREVERIVVREVVGHVGVDFVAVEFGRLRRAFVAPPPMLEAPFRRDEGPAGDRGVLVENRVRIRTVENVVLQGRIVLRRDVEIHAQAVRLKHADVEQAEEGRIDVQAVALTRLVKRRVKRDRKNHDHRDVFAAAVEPADGLGVQLAGVVVRVDALGEAVNRFAVDQVQAQAAGQPRVVLVFEAEGEFDRAVGGELHDHLELAVVGRQVVQLGALRRDRLRQQRLRVFAVDGSRIPIRGRRAVVQRLRDVAAVVGPQLPAERLPPDRQVRDGAGNRDRVAVGRRVVIDGLFVIVAAVAAGGANEQRKERGKQQHRRTSHRGLPCQAVRV